MIEPSAESLLFGRQGYGLGGRLFSVSIVTQQLSIPPLSWWAEKSLASQLHCSCSGRAFRLASLTHLFHFLVVSSFLAPVSAQGLPFCTHCLSYLHMHLCLIFALITAKARRGTGDTVSCPVAPSGCGGFSSFSFLFSLLTSCSFLSSLLRSFLPGRLSGFINIRRHSQCGSASIFLSPRRSCSYLLTARLSLSVPPPPSLPLSLFFFSHSLTVFVADSSAPQEHWGERRKQRFGSVALILIFCRLDGRLGGAFIHTAHNHFHCNCKPWLQTTGVVAICTNVPSVTRRLCVSYLKQWLVGEHNVLSIGPRETDVKCRMGKAVSQRHDAMHITLECTSHRQLKNVSTPVGRHCVCWV